CPLLILNIRTAQNKQERLATAPWNRAQQRLDRQFAAIRRSQEQDPVGPVTGAVIMIGVGKERIQTAGLDKRLQRFVAGHVQELAIGVVERIAGMDQQRHRQFGQDRGVGGPALRRSKGRGNDAFGTQRRNRLEGLLIGGFRRSRSSPTFALRDRKSTRLNSSHVKTSYAVFCLKKKTC